MTINYLIDLSLSLLGYLVLFCSFLGWGQFLSRLLKIENPARWAIFNQLWLGFVVCLAITQALHFFFPIAAPMSIALSLLGMLSFLFHFVKNIDAIKQCMNTKRRHVLYISITFCYAIWLASHSMQLPTAPDSFGYHFATIYWQNKYPTIFGLGLLDMRIAYNQSFFSYVALINAYPYYRHAYAIANSFFILVLFTQFLYLFLTLFPIFRKNTPSDSKAHPHYSVTELFAMLSFPIILLFSALSIDFFEMNIASPSPDIFIFLIQMVLMFCFLVLLEAQDSQARLAQLKVIILLSVCSLTLKLSIVVYSFLLAFSALLYVFFKDKVIVKTFMKLMPCFLLALGIFMVWCIRSVIQTGVPMFPVPFFWFDTEWSIPIGEIKNFQNLIIGWPKDKRAIELSWETLLNKDSWFWLSAWLEKIWITKILYNKYISFSFLFLSVLALLISLYSCFCKFHRSNIHNKKSFWMVYLPVLGGLSFWFFSAPDIRFVGALFCLVSILLSIHAYLLIPSYKIAQSYLVFLLFVLFLMVGRKVQHYKDISLSGYKPFPKRVKDVVKRTNSGLKIYLHFGGQSSHGDYPLPATGNFNFRKGLRLLGNSIEDGFSIQAPSPEL